MTGHMNWGPYNVPELAGILNDDFSGAWEQVGAWYSAQAMLDDAASQLEAARKGLAGYGRRSRAPRRPRSLPLSTTSPTR